MRIAPAEVACGRSLGSTGNPSGECGIGLLTQFDPRRNRGLPAAQGGTDPEDWQVLHLRCMIDLPPIDPQELCDRGSPEHQVGRDGNIVTHSVLTALHDLPTVAVVYAGAGERL